MTFPIIQDGFQYPKYLPHLWRCQKKRTSAERIFRFPIIQDLFSNQSRFIFQLFKLVNLISLQGPVTGPLYVLARALVCTLLWSRCTPKLYILSLSLGLLPISQVPISYLPCITQCRACTLAIAYTTKVKLKFKQWTKLLLLWYS